MSTTAKFSASAPVVTGGRVGDITIDASDSINVITPGSEIVLTLQDLKIRRVASATFDRVKKITARNRSGVVLTSETPAVCIINQDGQVTRVSDGECVITANSSLGRIHGSKSMPFSISRVVSGTADVVIPEQYAAGSLRKHAHDALADAFSGKTPGAAAQDIFTSVSVAAYGAGRHLDGRPLDSTSSATPNSECVFDPGLFSHTAFANWNSAPLTLSGVTDTWLRESVPCYFIGPRHAVYSTHVGLFDHVVVRRIDGSFVTTQRTASLNLGGDLSLAYFASDVIGVDYLKWLPEDYAVKLPGYASAAPEYAVPTVVSMFNPGDGRGGSVIPTRSRHLRPASVCRYPSPFLLAKVGASAGEVTAYRAALYPASANFMSALSEFASAAYGGDSSSMHYLPVNGQLAAMSLFTSPNIGPFLPSYTHQMNAQMMWLASQNGDSGVYAPVFTDLSMFASY